MSEFTYACPVCGQHIKCESSQAGTVMECPTCFQKITVPQAPATAESKFILTGTKVGERPMPKVAEATPITAPRPKAFPVGALLLVLLLCGATAALIILRGRIFPTHGNNNAETNQVVNATGNEPPAPVVRTNRPPPPVVIAPPSNDTNWMLKLGPVAFPDAPVAGRIHGRDFIAQRTVWQNGTLTFREGRSGPLNFALQINFGNVPAESLSGQSLNIATNALMAAHVTMLWQDGSEIAHEDLQNGYAMRLVFGQVNGNRLPGKIYYCAPDGLKSYIAGTFNAEIRRPRPRQ